MKQRFRKETRPISYVVIDNPGVSISERGPGLWCIAQPGMVLNNRGEWEAEPLPDKRTKEFIGRTRWPSPEAAYEFYCGYVASIPKRPFLVS